MGRNALQQILAVCALLCSCHCAFAAESARELTPEDIKAAYGLMGSLHADDFDTREKAQKDLRTLVFGDAAQAAAWNSWLERERAKATEQELQARLDHILLIGRLKGTWSLVHAPKEIDHDLVFEADGTYRLLVWHPYLRKMVPCGEGRFSVGKAGECALKGTIKTPFLPGAQPEDWEVTAKLVDGELRTKSAEPDSGEARFRRKSERPKPQGEK
ncbi:MAG: hypothetical protein NTW87_16155 [Planctomycetota bacterium]|nr:hypothetical protein [Planctomycetota bacterium]